MYGGIITGNSGYNGGGVYCELWQPNTIFNMYGGLITQNKASGAGAGVWFSQNQDGSGSISFSGDACIKDNYLTNNDVSNVYLAKDVKINIVGALSDKSSIGVTMKYPGVFTVSDDSIKASDYINCFTSDDDNYIVVADGDELKLDSANPYPLWVGGIEVSGANATNITGATTATASYNDITKSLTLNGYTYSGEAEGIRYDVSD